MRPSVAGRPAQLQPFGPVAGSASSNGSPGLAPLLSNTLRTSAIPTQGAGFINAGGVGGAGPAPAAAPAGGDVALWLPAPAGEAVPQSAAVTATSWVPFERVQSSLPDVRERLSAAVQDADSDPEAVQASMTRAQLAHSASEVSIELYGSAPSALEGSHDWGGRAGGSFADMSARAASLAAALADADGEDMDDGLGNGAADRLHLTAEPPEQQDSGLFDEDLALELDRHEAQGPHGSVQSAVAQPVTSSTSRPSGGRSTAARNWPAWAESAAQSPGSQSVTAESASPLLLQAGCSASTPAPQPAAAPELGFSGRAAVEDSPARLTWLPSPMFSSARQSASPIVSVPGSPDAVSHQGKQDASKCLCQYVQHRHAVAISCTRQTWTVHRCLPFARTGSKLRLQTSISCRRRLLLGRRSSWRARSRQWRSARSPIGQAVVAECTGPQRRLRHQCLATAARRTS